MLDLYDPDRSKVVLKAADRGTDYTEQSWDDFWKEFDDWKKAVGDGTGVAILGRTEFFDHAGASAREVQKAFPKLLWAEYEPWTVDGALSYNLEKADVILSLDSDFLGASEGTVRTIAGFAAGRRRLGKTQETMSRLYVVEGRFSLTGGMADHRLRLPSSSIGFFAAQLANTLGAVPLTGSVAASHDATVNTWITEVAKDLSSAKGRSLVICGSQQPPEVQALVAQITTRLATRA